MGWLYLLHFDQKIGDPERPHTSAQHYLGYADDYTVRIRKHINGYSDASIVRYVTNLGITIRAVRLFRGGTRTAERVLKTRGIGPRMCPICNERYAEVPGPKFLARNGLADASENLTPDMLGAGFEQLIKGRKWKRKLKGSTRSTR
jgi:hypothetical protein